MTVLSPLSTQPVIYQGELIIGAQIWTYDALTLNPRMVYADGDALTPMSNPFPSDGNGCIPPFFVQGAAYRVRILTADGSLIRDIDQIGADPQTSSSGGGGGDTAGLSTGDVIWRPTAQILDGRVRLNGRNIGPVGSGADERAAADTEDLFKLLWNTMPFLTVSGGGRGTSAADDFAAGKTIALPDMRGRAPFGFDDMGNLTAARLTGGKFDGTGSGVTVGSTGGEAAHQLTTAELAAHTHTGTTSSAGGHNHTGTSGNAGGHNHSVNDPGHQHGLNFITAYSNALAGGAINGGGTNSSTSSATTGITLAPVLDHAHTISTDGAHTHAFTSDSQGKDMAHNTMPPFFVGTWFILL